MRHGWIRREKTFLLFRSNHGGFVACYSLFIFLRNAADVIRALCVERYGHNGVMFLLVNLVPRGRNRVWCVEDRKGCFRQSPLSKGLNPRRNFTIK